MWSKKKRRKPSRRYCLSSKKIKPKFLFSKKFFKRAFRAFFVLISFLAVFSLVFLLFFTEIFAIKSWKIEVIRENAYLNSEAVKNYLVDAFREKKYSRNIFLFEEGEIQKDLLEKFLEIDKAVVKKIPPDAFRVYIFDRAISFVFIGPTGVKHFIDTAGISVAPREHYDLLEVYADFIGQEPQLHEKVFSHEEISEMLSVMHKFQNIFGIKVNKIGFLSASNEIHLHTDRGFKVMLERGKIERGFETLKGGLQKINIKEEKIEYIDLRIAPKMFVL